MKREILFLIRSAAVLMLGLATALGADKKPKGKAWTDPAKAMAEYPDFGLQGEYLGKGLGIQVACQAKEEFYVSRFAGGLPGAGWDGSAPAVSEVGRDAVKGLIAGFEKAHRTSPTLGEAPPEGAQILFNGEANPAIKGEIKDGLLWAGSQTSGEYGDFKLHVEFRLPFKPSAPLSSQDRGNSGLYLLNRYEVQVLDSFGLVFDKEQIAVPLKSDPKQWCGCLYKFKTPDVPMALPPLAWQTYDIEFTAPKFENSKKIANARITVFHNGVKIHDKVELPKGTGAGGKRIEVPKGPIVFQGHGNPIAYRNVWILKR